MIQTKCRPEYLVKHQQQEISSLPVQLVEYNIKHYSDSLYRSYHIVKPGPWKSWSIRRKASFLAGRIATQKAIKNLSFNPVEVTIGKNREPIWPQNIIGSISHSKGLSIATAIPRGAYDLGFGIDIQTVISNEEMDNNAKTVLTPADRILLEQSSGELTKNQLFTMIFSAKESFYKAAYATVGRYFDFNSMEASSINLKSGIISLVCRTRLTDTITAGNTYSVFFEFLNTVKPVIITRCHLQR